MPRFRTKPCSILKLLSSCDPESLALGNVTGKTVLCYAPEEASRWSPQLILPYAINSIILLSPVRRASSSHNIPPTNLTAWSGARDLCLALWWISRSHIEFSPTGTWLSENLTHCLKLKGEHMYLLIQELIHLCVMCLGIRWWRCPRQQALSETGCCRRGSPRSRWEVQACCTLAYSRYLCSYYYQLNLRQIIEFVPLSVCYLASLVF